jgi:hypothetical protein
MDACDSNSQSCAHTGYTGDFTGDSCYTGPVGTAGVGRCRTGYVSCTVGVSSCATQVLPGTEVCNGMDDDCDGMTDENATVEVCNSVDDDCDGAIDEGLVCP